MRRPQYLFRPLFLDADETFVVSFSNAKFDDRALASLASNFGDRIGLCISITPA